MTGLPGCGKTTVISALRQLVELAHVDTDKCWLELFPEPKYTPEESRTVFETVVGRTTKRLDENNSVIAEGVFASHERITRLREIAVSHNARFLAVGAECDFETANTRMQLRSQCGGNAPVPERLWTDLLSKLALWRLQEEVSWFDTVDLSPEECAQRITAMLSQK